MKRYCAFILFTSISVASIFAEIPQVGNVRALQRTDGTQIVDIYYDLTDSDSETLWISIVISDDNGQTYSITPQHVSGDIGDVQPGSDKKIEWQSMKDLPGVYGSEYRVKVRACETMIVSLPGLPNGVQPIEMTIIPHGSFMMGSPLDEIDRDNDEGPQHEVAITKDFNMSKYEITNAQFVTFLNWDVGNTAFVDDRHNEEISYSPETGWETIQGYENHPVRYITWDGAKGFCDWLTQTKGIQYRLPTEAEWEYAYRAGTTSRFYWSNDAGYYLINDYAWTYSNSEYKTHPVGEIFPNMWGLYDISGSIWEMCFDFYTSSYSQENQIDPVGPETGYNRVCRGGSFKDSSKYSRASYRGKIGLNTTSETIGFRIVAERP